MYDQNFIVYLIFANGFFSIQIIISFSVYIKKIVLLNKQTMYENDKEKHKTIYFFSRLLNVSEKNKKNRFASTSLIGLCV